MKRKYVIAFGLITGAIMITVFTGFQLNKPEDTVAVARNIVEEPTLVDETNQSLIDKEIKALSTEIYSYDEYNKSYLMDVANAKMKIKRSNGETLIVPEIFIAYNGKIDAMILPNGVPAVFSDEDGFGWYLKKGESLTLNVEVSPSRERGGTSYTISCILEDTFINPKDYDELKGNYTFVADKDGVYYMSIQNGTSKYLGILGGSISKN